MFICKSCNLQSLSRRRSRNGIHHKCEVIDPFRLRLYTLEAKRNASQENGEMYLSRPLLCTFSADRNSRHTLIVLTRIKHATVTVIYDTPSSSSKRVNHATMRIIHDTPTSFFTRKVTHAADLKLALTHCQMSRWRGLGHIPLRIPALHIHTDTNSPAHT